MQSTGSFITLTNVTKTYHLGKKGSVPAVRDVSLNIERGEFVVITGRSGCGKTTLLNLISGLSRPTNGKVRLGDTEVWQLPDAEQSRLRNQHVGFIFQFPSLMPSLTTLENVILPTINTPGRNLQALHNRAVELLHEVGLEDKLGAYPRHLSAGQQQRVVIARSLINQPELLLADEPTSNLDELTEREIMSLIQRIHQERGITVLLVTHSVELITYGTRSIRMARGEIVKGGDDEGRMTKDEARESDRELATR